MIFMYWAGGRSGANVPLVVLMISITRLLRKVSVASVFHADFLYTTRMDEKSKSKESIWHDEVGDLLEIVISNAMYMIRSPKSGAIDDIHWINGYPNFEKELSDYIDQKIVPKLFGIRHLYE